MRRIITLSLLTFVALCFQNCAPERPDFITDPSFTPYVKEFDFLANVDTSNIPIRFAQLPDDIAGVCYKVPSDWRGAGYSYIEIDQKYWPLLSQLQKKNLIFHELGHCALNRDHVPRNAVSECPLSFMNEAVMTDYCLRKYWNNYSIEMFGR